MQPEISPQPDRSLPQSTPSDQSGQVRPLFEPPQPRRRLSLGAGIALGIGAFLLLFIGVWLFQNGRSEDRNYRELAAQYVQPYPPLPRLSDPADLPQPLVQGLQAFQKRQFGQAAALLAQVPLAAPTHRLSQYYLGVALLAEGKYAAASEALQVASRAEAWQDREPAQYYLGVSLIGQGLTDAACTWLNPDGYHLATWYGGPVRELYGRFCP